MDQGFMGGLASSLQNMPQLMLQAKGLRMQNEQEQRIKDSQSRQQVAKSLETYDNIVNYVPEEQRPVAIQAWLSGIEQQTGQKLSPEIKKALTSGDPAVSKMLTQTFIDNPQINGNNLGQALNNEALVGMMISNGKKSAMEKATADAQLKGKNALDDGDNPATPENTAGLQAKAKRLEMLLADPTIPEKQRTSYEKILEQTTQQLGNSVDDKSKALMIARAYNLNPAIPQHQALLNHLMTAQAAAEAGAVKGAEADVQQVDPNTARDLGISPFIRQGEARSLNDVRAARLPTEAQKAADIEGAKQGEQPIPLDLAASTGINPLQNRREARTAFGGQGLEVPTKADEVLAGKMAEQTADTFKGYAQAGQDAASRRPVRDQVRALLPYAKTGFGAQQRLTLDRAAAAFGIDSKSLPPTQVLNMLSNKLALASRKDLPGQLSNQDRQFLLDSEVGINKDKNAIYMKMAMDDLIDQRIQDRAAAIPKYNRTCGPGGKYCENKTFDEVWNAHIAKNPLQPQFESIMKQYGYQGKGKAAASPSPAPASRGTRGGASGDWEDTPTKAAAGTQVPAQSKLRSFAEKLVAPAQAATPKKRDDGGDAWVRFKRFMNGG